MSKQKNTILGLLIGLITVSLWVFEIGPWNEAFRATIGTEVLAISGSSFLVGLTVTIFTFCVEFLSSIFVVIGLVSVHSPVRSFITKHSKKLMSDESRSHKVEDTAIALGLGSAILVVKKYAIDNQRKTKPLLKTSLVYSIVIAIFSGFVAFILAGGVQNLSVLERFLMPLGIDINLDITADRIIQYASSLWFWLIFFGGLWIISPKNRNLLLNKD